MVPGFSPFLAHLLMAGLARRALLHTDARPESPETDPAQSRTSDPGEAVPSPGASPGGIAGTR